jgi:3-methyl-2-oxobutanoate hydroxymethyltransferase
MFDGFTPKFVKRYAQLGQEMTRAFQAFKGEVEDGRFPGPEQEYQA